MALTAEQRRANAAAYKALSPEEKKSRISAVGLDLTGSSSVYTPSTNSYTTPVGASSGVQTPTNSYTSPSGNASFNPSYGANIANFDPTNQQHIALADAGQQWAASNRAGDQAGMDTAKSLGDQIRSGVSGASYNAPTGVSTLPTQVKPVQPVSSGASYQAPYMQLTPQQINTEASYQINKERSDLKNTVDHMIGQVRNNASYANQQIRDSRVLEDFSRQQTANPFGNLGRTSFNEGLIGRQRSIDDTYRAANLENELTRIQNDLYNFDKLAPDKQRTLMNEMTRIEREYGLEVGQLTGNFNGQRTLAGQTADRNYELDLAGLSGQLPASVGGGQTLAARNQSFNQNMATQQFDFQKSQQEWDNNFKSEQFDWNKAQQTWENTFKNKSFEQDMKDAAAARGLQWASLNQRDKEFIADQAFREEQFKYQKEQDTLKNTPKVNMDDEKRGLTDALRNGEISPEAASKQIDEDVQLGFYTQAEADELKKLIVTINSNRPQTAPLLTEEQASVQISDAELDKLYEQQGKGYPRLDWKQWYRDPRGRAAGTNFETWKSLYGPKLTG